MKNKNELESFIHAHRHAFDDERPSLKVWTEIERALKVSDKKISRTKIFWRGAVAASLLLLFGIGLGLIIYPRMQEMQVLQAVAQQTELNEMELFFSREVATKLVALAATPIEREIKESLEETDQQIQKLKLDLIYAPKSSREEILQAIIASYEAKIHILQTALERVSPIKISENEATIL